MTPLAPLSIGDLFDRISILEIKLEKISDKVKLGHIHNELNALNNASLLYNFPWIQNEYVQLKEINKSLWDIEDQIRDCENRKCFDDNFIQLARSVYLINDKRSALKKIISERLGSELIEVKSYKEYVHE
jgi:hypothetical protein